MAYESLPNWPSNWQTSTITGHYVDSLGAPLAGEKVHLLSSAPVLLSVSTKTTVFMRDIPITLDSNGSFSIEVPGTDDTDINPPGFTYRVTEKWEGGRTFDIPAPIGTTKDISEIAPVPASGGAPITRGDPGILVLAVGAPIPVGTPPGTIIGRTST